MSWDAGLGGAEYLMLIVLIDMFIYYFNITNLTHYFAFTIVGESKHTLGSCLRTSWDAGFGLGGSKDLVLTVLFDSWSGPGFLKSHSINQFLMGYAGGYRKILYVTHTVLFIYFQILILNINLI